MKISKIAKLCKDAKLVCMTSTEAGLWIGNGNAVYFVPKFTNMDCDGIALAFGIDEKKKEKIIFTNLDMSGFNMKDIDPAESLCEPMGINFWQEGDILRPYKTEAGVLCLVGSYLEPLRDEMEAREVYLRYAKDGKPYAKSQQVAKVGNSVPPAFATAIVRANWPERCKQEITTMRELERVIYDVG